MLKHHRSRLPHKGLTTKEPGVEDQKKLVNGCIGKRKFLKRTDARKRARVQTLETGVEYEEYPCQFCAHYHTGHRRRPGEPKTRP